MKTLKTSLVILCLLCVSTTGSPQFDGGTFFMKRLNIVGERYGKLVVLQFSHIKKGTTYFLCQCDCGGTKVVESKCLRQGLTGSCGCMSSRLTQGTRATTHGWSETKEYRAWQAMKKRCYNGESTERHKDYGGRGITVCDRWRNSFENFLADLGPRPSEKHSIDRIDNNGNYTPENCRWATRKEQGANKRNNRLITYNGETLTLSQLADKYGVKLKTLWDRLNMGWSIERALTKPIRTITPYSWKQQPK